LAKNLYLVSTDLGALIASLEENVTLKLLDILCNQLDSTPLFTRLASALTANQTLEALILQRCNISNDCCNILAEKLPYMKGLKDLNLNQNPFYNSGARGLLDGLKANVNLLLSLQVEKSSFECYSCGPLDMDYHKAYKKEYLQLQSLVHVNCFLSSVHTSLTLPPNLWLHVLETADNDLDVTYFMLYEEILLHLLWKISENKSQTS
jgi:Ran GTPase-activating protein (RanGAP) involved in mRNA processing and transport